MAGVFQIEAKHDTSIELFADTVNAPVMARQGQHYELCYSKNTFKEQYMMPFGQIYVLEPLR